MMNLTKKKSVVQAQVDEFSTTTALVEATASDALAVVTEAHAARDAAPSYSATGLALDATHGEAELVVVPVMQSPLIDKLASLKADTLGSSVDSGKLLNSMYVDQSGGWGLQVAPDNIPDASEQAISGASEKALEAEILELAKPAINVALDDSGVAGEIDDGGTTDDATPTFSGYGEPFATLIVYDNGVSIGDTAIGQDGTWSFSVSEPLDLGMHSFTVAVAGVMSDPFALRVSAPEAGGPGGDSALDNTAELVNGATIGDAHPHPVLTDRGSSEPFVLHVDSSTAAVMEESAGKVDEGAISGLVLADLLQLAAPELLAGDKNKILPVGDTVQVLDLPSEAFGSAAPASAQLPVAAEFISETLAGRMPAELWQLEAAA